jgi:hypothetical protein
LASCAADFRAQKFAKTYSLQMKSLLGHAHTEQ